MRKNCPICQTPITDLNQCSHCQLIFSKYEENARLKKKMELLDDGDEQVHEKLIAPDSYKRRLLSFPIIASLSIVSVLTPLKHLFMYFFIWMHELGHALMSWLSGIKATPISFGFFGMTFQGGEKSSIVFICFLFLLLLMFQYSRKNRYPLLGIFAVILSLLSIVFTLIVPLEKNEELIVFAGAGGEIILGSILISAFYYELPPKLNWSYLRWPSSFLGFFVLMTSTLNWFNVLRFKSLNQMGANFSEEAVLGVPGDFHRLMNEFGWAYPKFLRIYLGLCFLGWILVLGHYFYFAFILRNKNKALF